MEPDFEDMNELAAFNYGDLEPETAEFACERAQRIRHLVRLTAQIIAEIGRNLVEVKERLGHGKFLEWISHEFDWTDRTARRFMIVHERFKSDNLSDLEIDVSALYLIAAPKTPEPVRLKLIQRAQSGERVTHAVAKAAIEDAKRLEELEAIIGPRMPQYAAIAMALLAIRDGQLYRESHQTFEDYCQDRWNFDLEMIELALEFAAA